MLGAGNGSESGDTVTAGRADAGAAVPESESPAAGRAAGVEDPAGAAEGEALPAGASESPAEVGRGGGETASTCGADVGAAAPGFTRRRR